MILWGTYVSEFIIKTAWVFLLTIVRLFLKQHIQGLQRRMTILAPITMDQLMWTSQSSKIPTQAEPVIIQPLVGFMTKERGSLRGLCVCRIGMWNRFRLPKVTMSTLHRQGDACLLLFLWIINYFCQQHESICLDVRH